MQSLESVKPVGVNLKSLLVAFSALIMAIFPTSSAFCYTEEAPFIARRLLSAPKLSGADEKMLDQIQRAHFEYFLRQSDNVSGLTKDRSRQNSAASIAAVGFSLTAFGVAVDHGWISRELAADYTLKVLNTLWSGKQGSEPRGVNGNHGFFYHFLNCQTGERDDSCELSTIDTTLLLAGVLFCKNYYTAHSAKETQIRNLADKIYRRVDWNWAAHNTDRISMGWTPEHGFIERNWTGYDEASLLCLLAMGSPTHPTPASTWQKYMATAKIGSPYGRKQMQFGPLFGHQYTQVWIDMRELQNATTKKVGFDFFQNSRAATLTQHDYAIDNPLKYDGYSALDWGLTACDGPGSIDKIVGGRKRKFYNYVARGYPSVPPSPDDGTIAPTAAAASLPFAPEIVLPTLRHWLKKRPEIFSSIGFRDAFNPTFDRSEPSGWVDPECIGIDQGPIVLMIENYRSASVWKVMARDSYIQTALKQAGFKDCSAGSR